MPAFGHTPGHSCFVISDGDAWLMVVANCTDSPVPLALHPERRRIHNMITADRIATTGCRFRMADWQGQV